VVVGLAAGHLLGGPDAEDRTVLALSTASRRPAIAMAIAHTNFPEQTLAMAAVLLYLIVDAIVALPYLNWTKRRHAPGPDRKNKSPFCAATPAARLRRRPHPRAHLFTRPQHSTAAGPMLYLFVPSSEPLAVGSVNVGPTPQMISPGFAGDRKNVGLISPIPKALSAPSNSDGWLMMGVMIREIRF
jgi:hypothetical protein